MSCFRVFGVFRGSDLRNEGSYYLQVTEDDFARAGSVFAEVRKAHGLCLIFTVVWS